MKNGVLIGYISDGTTRVEFASNLSSVTAYSIQNGVPLLGALPRISGPRIASARNHLVRSFLSRDDVEWLLMIDCDMTFTPDVVERFLKVADKKKAPIVGGLCFGKGADGLFPTIYHWNGKSFTRSEGWDENTMVPCDGTGGAAMFVHRSVFEEMAKHFKEPWVWFEEQTLNGREAGEDMTFCLRARSMDFPIFVHTGIQFGHVKEFEVDPKFYHDWCQSHRMIVTGVPSNDLAFVSQVLQRSNVPADYERFFNTQHDHIPKWGRADVSWLAAPHLARHADAHIVEITSDDDEPIIAALEEHGEWIRKHAPNVINVETFRKAWSDFIDPYVTQRMTREQVTGDNLMPAVWATGNRHSVWEIDQQIAALS